MCVGGGGGSVGNLISDRIPKRMFNVREVLDLLVNSDIEVFIISDAKRQANSNDDYNPIQNKIIREQKH